MPVGNCAMSWRDGSVRSRRDARGELRGALRDAAPGARSAGAGTGAPHAVKPLWADAQGTSRGNRIGGDYQLARRERRRALRSTGGRSTRPACSWTRRRCGRHTVWIRRSTHAGGLHIARSWPPATRGLASRNVVTSCAARCAARRPGRAARRVATAAGKFPAQIPSAQRQGDFREPDWKRRTFGPPGASGAVPWATAMARAGRARAGDHERRRASQHRCE